MVTVNGGDFDLPMRQTTSACAMLAGGATCTVNVVFNPQKAGAATGTLIASGTGCRCGHGRPDGNGLDAAKIAVSPTDGDDRWATSVPRAPPQHHRGEPG
jgi:hypothetical protein